MILMHSGFVVPLVFLAFCYPIVEEKSYVGKPTEVLASSVDQTRTGRSPKENLKPSGSGETVRVLWRVSGFVLGPRAAMDRAEADMMLAKPLDIGKDRIVFDRKACEGVKFKRTKERLSDYLERVYKVTPKELDVTDELIEVIKTDCNLQGFQEYIRLGDRRLVIQVKGVFFFFKPNVTY
jgi:hypothetical protein